MKVFIYPNFDKKNALSCAMSVCDILSDAGVELFADEKYIYEFSSKNVSLSKLSDIISECDMVIAIGGDGTIIKAVAAVSPYNKAVLGINSGRLGFLAAIEHSQLDLLKNVIDGNCFVEEHTMMKIKHKSGETVSEYTAVNDIVIFRKDTKLGDFSLYINDRLINEIRADGIIFSTPTGSTAHALSAGGAIIEPDTDCIEFVPICSHSLFARPIIFSASNDISVFHSSKSEDVYFTVDGGKNVQFLKTDELIVSKSDIRMKLVQIEGNCFFNTVNKKLMQSIKGEN
ncbi:MAG: NAD(+)/NADH kinase [Oscillospiraceae bacterium]|nr:NAD(+)/NADH kinase [Oscillospiraceae bacterium]